MYFPVGTDQLNSSVWAFSTVSSFLYKDMIIRNCHSERVDGVQDLFSFLCMSKNMPELRDD